MGVVAVHGIGNYRTGHTPGEAAQQIAGFWRKHLRSGPLGQAIDPIPLTAAYYAHHLRVPGGQNGRIAVADLSEEEIAMVRQWLDECDEALGFDPGTPQGLGSMPIRQALGILADRFGFARPAVELFAAAFFREVHRYLSGDTPHRTLARMEVANRIAEASEPRVVLAHSLGSVVAFEALTRYPQIEIDLLITLGSPLAARSLIFHRLDPRPVGDPAARPPGVKRWINIADKGDLIAVPRRGVAKRFRDVQHIDVTIHWLEFHMVANYLRTAAVADNVRDYLR